MTVSEVTVAKPLLNLKDIQKHSAFIVSEDILVTTEHTLWHGLLLIVGEKALF